MKFAFAYRVFLIVTAALAAGCDEQNASVSHEATTTPLANGGTIIPSVDRWLGQWTGPEGTSLILSKSEDGYRVTIHSLDGPANYQGKLAGDHIEFERNGKTESIRATDGKGTGMKWLQEKTHCLTIQLSEGFCLD